MGDVLVRLGVRAIPFGIAALVSGFVLKSPGTQAGPADIGLPAPGLSVFGTIHPEIFRLRAPLGSELPALPVRLASLEPRVGSDAANGWGMVTDPLASACVSASFADDRPASFDRRFAPADECAASFDESFRSAMQELAGSLRLPPDRDVEEAIRLVEPRADAPPARTASRKHVRPGQTHKEAIAAAPAASARRHIRPGQKHTDSIAAVPQSLDPASASSVPSPENDGRTAIYDIAAGAVYLPDGRKLEAHSGIGNLMDNPRHVHMRMRGATPPNVYKLSLRQRLFHGVRALRLTPADERRMHGRDGILAHSYLLGPKGQSHGCVAFRNYPEFLNAFLKGEVTRIVVVERLDSPPGPKLASGQLPDAVRDLLKASERTRQYAAASGH